MLETGYIYMYGVVYKPCLMDQMVALTCACVDIDNLRQDGIILLRGEICTINVYGFLTKISTCTAAQLNGDSSSVTC